MGVLCCGCWTPVVAACARSSSSSSSSSSLCLCLCLSVCVSVCLSVSLWLKTATGEASDPAPGLPSRHLQAAIRSSIRLRVCDGVCAMV